MILQRSRRAFCTLIACSIVVSCVSIDEYTQVIEQLAIEQRHSREAKDRHRQMAILAERLQKRLRVCSLERDEAIEKLAAAGKALPVSPAAIREAASVRYPSGAKPVLVGTIFFLAGRDVLSDADRKKLSVIGRDVSQMPPGEVIVAGHSDPTPIGKTKYESNMHLSAVRALAVYHALVKLPGIDIGRVFVAAHGEYKPMHGSRKQRRVEILYLPAGR